MASAALYSASLRHAAAAATATKSSTSPEATASSSLSCLQWKISSCSTHSAPHVRRRHPVAAAAAAASSRASARNAIHWNRDPHPSSKCPSFPKENPSRHKICAMRRLRCCCCYAPLGDYKKRWRYVGLFYRFNAESHRFRFDLGILIFQFQ